MAHPDIGESEVISLLRKDYARRLQRTAEQFGYVVDTDKVSKFKAAGEGKTAGTVISVGGKLRLKADHPAGLTIGDLVTVTSVRKGVFDVKKDVEGGAYPVKNIKFDDLDKYFKLD